MKNFILCPAPAQQPRQTQPYGNVYSPQVAPAAPNSYAPATPEAPNSYAPATSAAPNSYAPAPSSSPPPAYEEEVKAHGNSASKYIQDPN